ncbi:10958_t:CDS:2, partial [Funneliformis caledonium]
MNEGEYYKTLSIDFNKLLTTCEDYNVIIGVGNDVDYMKFHAHSCILRARSPYFYSALSKEWVKRNEEGLIIFEKPNIHPKIFQCILKYIYGGMIDLNDYEPIISNYEKRLMIQDGSKWVEEDLIELEIILKNCVPLIRIDLISCKELPIELQPFQRMLTKNDSFIDDNSSDLYSDENLMCKSLLLSHRMPSIYPIDSTIIKWRHAAIISKWIDRQDALYHSFIFSFGDGKNLNQAVLSRIRKDHDGMALFCADVRGPSFGCHDLWMPNFNNLSLRCTSKSSYYEKTIIDTRKFDVEEYE